MKRMGKFFKRVQNKRGKVEALPECMLISTGATLGNSQSGIM